MTRGLSVVFGDDLESLADHLSERERANPLAVLEPLWVIVPSSPVRQWVDWLLSSRLGSSEPSSSDGIAANLRYLFPDEFVRHVEEITLEDLGRRRVNWDLASLSISIMARSAVPYERARRLAREIDEIVRWRPDYLVDRTSAPSELSETLAAYDRLGDGDDLPLAQREAVRQRLRRAPVGALPSRIVQFGASTVAGGPGYAALVADLAEHLEFVVLSPSPGVHGSSAQLDMSNWFDESVEAREVWCQLGDRCTIVDLDTRPREVITTLGALQSRLRGTLASGDVDDADSVRLVGATGLARQVEVARDLILRAVAAGIAPHEIAVVSPDPSLVAAHLERHWGFAAREDVERPPRLAYELTEVVGTSGDNRLETSLALLDLVGDYATARRLEQFLVRASVGERLGLARSDLERIFEVASQQPVTFGVSRDQRAIFDVYGDDDDGSGTWERLNDRVVASWTDPASTDSANLGVPADVATLALIQPLLRLLDAQGDGRGSVATLPQWLGRLEDWMEAASPPGGEDDSFERALVRGRGWSNTDGAGELVLSLDDFRSLWGDGAVQRVRQRTFGSRGVVVTSATSMPYAPYRVVCLLGLDEDALPPASFASAVLAQRRIGDPDPRRAVLSSLLGWVSSAREQLIVTYNDRHESHGRACETAIPFEELLTTISLVSGRDRSRLIETTPRHAFAVTAEGPGVLSTTYDGRLGDLNLQLAVGRLPGQGVRESLRHVEAPELTSSTLIELRRFLRAPVTRFVRDTLGAALPTPLEGDAEFPAVALDGLTRFQLQYEYVTRLATELAAHFTGAGGVPNPPEEPHAATSECLDEPCAVLHGPALTIRDELISREGPHRTVPERLWRYAMSYPLLELAAYNLATDLMDLAAPSNDVIEQLPDFLALGATTSLQLGPAATLVELLDLREDTATGALVLVRLSCRRDEDHRDLLIDALDVAVVVALTGRRDVELRRFALPGRHTPYGARPRGTVPAGHYALNPLVVLRFNGGEHEALGCVERFGELFERGRHSPLALFRRQSAANVATGLRHGARSSDQLKKVPDFWTTTDRSRGESGESAHRLLYPVVLDDLARLEPVAGETTEDSLAEILEPFLVTVASQTKRRAPASVRARTDLGAPWLARESAGAPTALEYPLVERP